MLPQGGGRRPTDFDAQLALVFDRALNRAPTAEERSMLRRLVRTQPETIHAPIPRARASCSAKAKRRCRQRNRRKPSRLAAMATVTRAVLNLHEMITRN